MNRFLMTMVDIGAVHVMKTLFGIKSFAQTVADLFCGKVGEVRMSATIYKWIVVYDDGRTEEKYGASPYDFADDLIEVPVAIIRNGWEW